MNYYQQSYDTVIKELETNSDTGLSENVVRYRLHTYGPNELPRVKERGWFAIFISQFENPLIYILLVAATIIFFVSQDKLDAFIISGVLFFNAIVGTIQEGRTRSIIESLKRFIKTTSVVLRSGQKIVVDDSQLVVGDIILLTEGQRVPADARVITSHNLQIDESTLTGESGLIYKTDETIKHEAALADRVNMLYRGTYVMAGSGKAVVVATGANTEIGKIHKTVEEIKTEIPLKKELEHLSYVILLFILVMCILLFIIGFLTGKPLTELLIMLTALFICVVPEGLPVVLTLVLVTGAYRMARQHVLVKNMQAVETLGRTDVIIIDKTGTLTRNELAVICIYADGKVYQVSGEGYHDKGELALDAQPVDVRDIDALYHMGIATSLLNNTEITYLPKLNMFDIKGNQTEAALFVASKKMGFDQAKLEQEYTQIYEIPFDAKLKYHAAFYQHNDKIVAYITGAPESLMICCEPMAERTEKELMRMLDEGLRVIAIGMKEFDPAQMPKGNGNEHFDAYAQLLKNNIQLLGFMGIEDAIRPEVRALVEQVRKAGLHVVMATGDHQKTALYVAKKTDIYRAGDQYIDGPELAKISDEKLFAQLDNTTVFSRVTPAQKMRIVQLFNAEGKIVAMTGDGINDAPSLVTANLGIAMGNIGTEVAKAAADIVLLNDSFANIVNAIEQGRHIFQILRKVVLYFFATNMGEILIVMFALIIGLPLPITAAQILWLNLVTDGFLDVGLSMEPKEANLLDASWLRNKMRLVDAQLLWKMLYMAVPMGIGSLWVFWHYYEINITYARTMTLLTMAMFQWFNAWNCRSETQSIFQLGLFANRGLMGATFFVLSLQFILIYTPWMQFIFKTVPLDIHDWAVVFVISSSIVVIEEVRKFIWRRI